MQCPFCQHPNNRVLESRSAESDRSIRRRRECLACDRRFTTYERIEYVPITVIKRRGDRESFDRSKLLRGIVTACEKTGVSAHTLEIIVDEIEADCSSRPLEKLPAQRSASAYWRGYSSSARLPMFGLPQFTVSFKAFATLPKHSVSSKTRIKGNPKGNQRARLRCSTWAT